MNFMGKLVFKDKIMSSSFDLKSVSDVIYNFMEYMYGSLFVLNRDRGIFTFINNKLKFKLSRVTAFFSDFFG